MLKRLRTKSQAGLFLASLVAATAFVLVMPGLWKRWPFAASRDSTIQRDDITWYLGDDPAAVTPFPIIVSLPPSQAMLQEWAELLAEIHPNDPEPSARSRRLHALRLGQLLPEGSAWIEKDGLGRIVQVSLPGNPVIESWRGVEIISDEIGDRTEHRDQLLSALAEAGVPLSCRLHDATAESHDLYVKDLLRTSLQEFHLGQEEISWTAVAFSLYLPPQAYWENRFGERYTFSQLATEIMGRSLTEESCGGTHLVMSLTQLLRVDQEYPVLDPPTRAAIGDYLKGKVVDAISTQRANGSWPIRWSVGEMAPASRGQFTPESTDALQIVVTGHLVEWFHYLPNDLKPPRKTVDAAVHWLRHQLMTTPSQQIRTEFCPFTHAVRAIDLAHLNDE